MSATEHPRFLSQEEELDWLRAENHRLRAALEPFASAATSLDVVPDEAPDGTMRSGSYVWKGREQNQMIWVWFGPSDFGQAQAALQPDPRADPAPAENGIEAAWAPPADDLRPSGYRCLGLIEIEWTCGQWSPIEAAPCGMIPRVDPVSFAPMPPGRDADLLPGL